MEEIRGYILSNGYTLKGIEKAIKGIKRLAGDTNYTSAILTHKGVKYDVYIIKPWHMVPAGKIEINRM